MRKFLTIILSLFVGAMLSACIFLWMAAGEIYDYTDTFDFDAHSKNIDVVLCLAGGKGRIPVAVELWNKIKSAQQTGKSPILFFSGVGPLANFETLIEQGVPKEFVSKIKKQEVVFENVSANTFENAQIFASFARQNQWKNILIVTASYHMKRSSDILQKALEPEVMVYHSTVGAEHFHRNDWHNDAYAIRVTIMEYIKWLFYRYSY